MTDYAIATLAAANKLMRVVTDTVMTHTVSRQFDIMHEVNIPSGAPRFGYYRVILQLGEARTSHMFDIALLMDMRDSWDEYAKHKTRAMMEECVRDARV